MTISRGMRGLTAALFLSACGATNTAGNENADPLDAGASEAAKTPSQKGGSGPPNKSGPEPASPADGRDAAAMAVSTPPPASGATDTQKGVAVDAKEALSPRDMATVVPDPQGPKSSFLYVSGYDSKVSIFPLDGQGVLGKAATAQAGYPASYLAIAPSKKFLFAGVQANPSKIISMAIDAASGGLKTVNSISTMPGDGAVQVTVHPSSRWVFVAHYGSGHASVLPVSAEGLLGAATETLFVGANAHGIMTDPAGKHVFVTSTTAELVAQFIFDSTTGKLTKNTPSTISFKGKGSPRHMAFAPSGKFAYVITEGGSQMASLKYDEETGKLSAPEFLSLLPAGVSTSNSGSHVVVAPSGRFVYGANRGHDSMVTYAVNADTGRLTLVGHDQAEGSLKNPRDFTLSPDGKFLVAVNQGPRTAVVFKVDTDSGKLTKLSVYPTPTLEPTYAGILTLP